jgi:isoamylase
MNNWMAIEGSPLPLGVTWIEEEQAYNFGLFSRYATGVTLLLYSDQDYINPVFQLKFDFLKNKSGMIWHCRVPKVDMKNARYYAYKVEGINDPATGHRFDPQKILLDPYARSVFFPPDFSRKAAEQFGSNAGKAPLGVIHTNHVSFDWENDRSPRHTHDTIIYELHVRGFTRRPNSGVSPEKRGTFAGIIEKIPYLKELGVTAVELLPIHQCDPQEGSYWGYMTLNFFSPHHEYGSTRVPEELFNEFKAMVKALHEAGIEVILDVVYNHTTEIDHTGPTYSYRGIDNKTYYLLEENMAKYKDDAGCGNVLRAAHPTVRKMIIDSLRFWNNEMHVDGFRFDLASIFTRDLKGSVNLDDPAVISEISANSEFSDVRLIAEAWDISSYQLGRSYPGISWYQWNGKFRDDIRSFLKGDNSMIANLITRLYGSDDLFPDRLDNVYHPYQSINFITAHDGFCLYDLVSYNTKHNESNGYNNTDGSDQNFSWNHGCEGDENVTPEVMELRKRQIKNFCCLLMLSNGTPMFCAGDEFLNTQGGNNNPYNQNNETTWLDWDLLEKNRDIFRFFKNMIAFRKSHPSLGRSRYWREDVIWHGVGKNVDLREHSHSLAFYLKGASQQDKDIYVMINAYWEALEFKIQQDRAEEWERVVDTALPSPSDFAEPGSEETLKDLTYSVKPRSIVVLVRK